MTSYLTIAGVDVRDPKDTRVFLSDGQQLHGIKAVRTESDHEDVSKVIVTAYVLPQRMSTGRRFRMKPLLVEVVPASEIVDAQASGSITGWAAAALSAGMLRVEKARLWLNDKPVADDHLVVRSLDGALTAWPPDLFAKRFDPA